MLNCQIPTRFALGGLQGQAQNKRGLLLGTPALLPGAGRGRAAVQTRPTAPTCLARAVLAPLLVPHFYPRRAALRSKGKPEQVGLRPWPGGNEDEDRDTGCNPPVPPFPGAVPLIQSRMRKFIPQQHAVCSGKRRRFREQ